jgi:hypothetical protein
VDQLVAAKRDGSNVIVVAMSQITNYQPSFESRGCRKFARHPLAATKIGNGILDQRERLVAYYTVSTHGELRLFR